MRKYSQAVTVGSIVKHRIEEEINKRQKSPSETSQDAVAGTDVGDVQDDEEGEDIGSSAAIPAAETISSEAEKLEISGDAKTKRSKDNDDSMAVSSTQPK